MLLLAADRAYQLCHRALTHVGLPDDEAATCADCIMFATLRGLDSHGIVSILPGIANAVAQGTILPNAPIEIRRQNTATALLKGNGAAGPVIGRRTMDEAIARARHLGVGVAVAYNCHHFGAASYYAHLALQQGLFGLAMCNAAASVAPYGGRTPLHGTNPISYAAPANAEPPIVLDIATSAAAHGQIFKARRRGQAIPSGWAIDDAGQPTTDPAAARVLLPFGGHKGYGLGVLVDLLTGALAGSTVGRGVIQPPDGSEHGGQSFFMLAIDPEAFGGSAAFVERVDRLVREAKEIAPQEGFDEVLLPGELEHRTQQRRAAEGIPLYDEDWQALREGLSRAGVPAALIAEHEPTTAR